MSGETIDLRELRLESFQPCLNQTFHIVPEGADPVAAELIEATDLRRKNPDGSVDESYQAFSLVFGIPSTVRLVQKIYRVEHERMGSMDIFLVPIAPDRKGNRMEAVFNMMPIDR